MHAPLFHFEVKLYTSFRGSVKPEEHNPQSKQSINFCYHVVQYKAMMITRNCLIYCNFFIENHAVSFKLMIKSPAKLNIL